MLPGRWAAGQLLRPADGGCELGHGINPRHRQPLEGVGRLGGPLEPAVDPVAPPGVRLPELRTGGRDRRLDHPLLVLVRDPGAGDRAGDPLAQPKAGLELADLALRDEGAGARRQAAEDQGPPVSLTGGVDPRKAVTVHLREEVVAGPVSSGAQRTNDPALKGDLVQLRCRKIGNVEIRPLECTTHH